MPVLASFAFIFAMLVVGRLLAWRRVVPDDAPAALNLVVLYVCLPAAVLLHAPRLQFERALLGLVALPWLILVASAATTLAMARVLRFDRASTAALLLLVALGNTSFLGFALVPALAGEAALRYAVVYDQFGSFLILSTFGLVVLGLYGVERPTPRAIARRILGFPPFIALLVALLLMPPAYPDAIARPLELLADSLLPLVALASGMWLLGVRGHFGRIDGSVRTDPFRNQLRVDARIDVANVRMSCSACLRSLNPTIRKPM